jgi:hypothetical protein
LNKIEKLLQSGGGGGDIIDQQLRKELKGNWILY